MFEVRCSCQPTNVLGHLPAPDGLRSGDTWYFAIMAPSTPRNYVEAAAMDAKSTKPFDRVTLMLATFVSAESDGHRQRHLAFKADGLTIEQLCNFVGFVEAGLSERATDA